MTEFEAVEREIRAAEAKRVVVLAKAQALAHAVDDSSVRAAKREYAAASTSANPRVRERARAQFSDSQDSRRRSIAYRSMVADLAAAVRLTEQTLEHHIAHAVALAEKYPTVLASLKSGHISPRHSTVIVDAGMVIGTSGLHDSEEVAARREQYESMTLSYAEQVSPNLLRPYARRIAEQFADESLDERHKQEKTRRRVWVEAREDGMALLCAYLPADVATATYDRLTRMAKHTAEFENRAHADAKALASAQGIEPPPDERRTLNEIRADLLADFLSIDFTREHEDLGAVAETAETSGNLGVRGPVRGVVQVIIHEDDLAETETRASSNNGSPEHRASTEGGKRESRTVPFPELEGYGPIPVSMAREIAGSAKAWVDIVVNSGTGDIKRVESRAPSADQKRKLLARDQHCRWPGCKVAGLRCDIDHTIPVADGGPTAMWNLGFLCRHHHTLKHEGGWSVTQDSKSDFTWRSPSGRTHTTRPASRVRFRQFEPADGEPGAAPPPTAREPERFQSGRQTQSSDTAPTYSAQKTWRTSYPQSDDDDTTFPF